jgi:hypothetical protein
MGSVSGFVLSAENEPILSHVFREQHNTCNLGYSRHEATVVSH